MTKRRPNVPTPRQSKSALLEAAQAAVADQRGRPIPSGPPAPPEPGSRTFLRVLLGSLIIAGAVILGLRPSWLTSPPPPPESPAIQTASATLALVEAVSRVNAFQQIRGSLPRTLAEAGVADRSISYRQLTRDTFEVAVPAGDSTLTIRSTEPLKPKVVQAILTLQRRS